MTKSKGTRTAWCVLAEDDVCDPEVRFAPERHELTDDFAYPYMTVEDFEDIFGWLPGKRPVEVQLQKVHRRQTGAPRTARKSRAKPKPTRPPRRGKGRPSP